MEQQVENTEQQVVNEPEEECHSDDTEIVNYDNLVLAPPTAPVRENVYRRWCIEKDFELTPLYRPTPYEEKISTVDNKEWRKRKLNEEEQIHIYQGHHNSDFKKAVKRSCYVMSPLDEDGYENTNALDNISLATRKPDIPLPGLTVDGLRIDLHRDGVIVFAIWPDVHVGTPFEYTNEENSIPIGFNAGQIDEMIEILQSFRDESYALEKEFSSYIKETEDHRVEPSLLE